MTKAKKKFISIEDLLVPIEEQPYDVPSNWCWTYIKTGFDVTSSKRVHKSDWLESGIPFYRTRELVKLSEDGVVDNELFISEELYDELITNYEKPLVGDLLISGVGTIGIPYVVKTDNKFYFKDGNVIWLKNKNLFDPDYVFYLYKSVFMHNQIYDMSAGTTVDTYTIVNANATKIPLPPIKEQRRIVEQIESLFAKLDEAKEKAELCLDGFTTRKESILYKAFKGELTLKWRQLHNVKPASHYLQQIIEDGKCFSRKDFKFWTNEELPEGWSESKIGNLLYYAGRIGWKGLKAEEYTEEGPLFLSVYNLNDGDEVTYNRVYHITEERYEESPEIMVDIGDVLLTKDGAGIGKLGYVKNLPQRATINSSLLLIRPGEVADSKYVFYLLSGPELQRLVKERITGSATPHLFQRDIKEFVIPVPTLEEQKEIVRVLDDILDKEKQAYESARNVIDSVALIKKSILSKAFRGELGTNDPTEESSVELLKQIQQ